MKQYIVDAFAQGYFTGNPAAVCVLNGEEAAGLDDQQMQAIAVENNLSETAFAKKEDDGYSLRWFTPGGEIDLCGHATLAAAWVILHFYKSDLKAVEFHTRSGLLQVEKKNDGMLEMDFPAYEMQQIPVEHAMEEAIGFPVREAWLGRDLVCVLDNAEKIRTAMPDLVKAEKLPGLLLHITAPSDQPDCDCISRSFAPKLKVSEDPVCGSGHCHIIPLWAEKLNKNILTARQASQRGGMLYCTLKGDRIAIAGKAVLYAVCELFPDCRDEKTLAC